jgi:hypothetical protein
VTNVSVIIPIGPGEDTWEGLLPQLLDFKECLEIILMTSLSEQEAQIREKTKLLSKVKVLRASGGRGALMNFAAVNAKASFLWFLHADTELPVHYANSISKAIRNNGDVIYYFDLTFIRKGFAWMRLNEVGTYFRSHVLKLPFGDQGFLMSKSVFFELGKYKENVKYGEDHLLIWQAHHQKIPVLCIGETIATSARKYNENGWFKVTSIHLILTFRQAFPELLKLIFRKSHRTLR